MLREFNGSKTGSLVGDHLRYEATCQSAVSNGDSRSNFTLGSFDDALARTGAGNEYENDYGHDATQQFKLPGVAGSPRDTQVLVWPHGQCDVKAVLRACLIAHGFHTVDHKKRGTAPSTRQDPVIRDTTPFDGQMYNTPMPSGYVSGASGSTQSQQNFWQLPSNTGWFSNQQVNVEEPVHLSVTSCTWYFNEIGDFETRVLLSVFAGHQRIQGLWAERTDLVAKYTARLQALANNIFEAISQYRPTGHALMMRKFQQGPSAGFDFEPSFGTMTASKSTAAPQQALCPGGRSYGI